jgi:hypothetical protein
MCEILVCFGQCHASWRPALPRLMMSDCRIAFHLDCDQQDQLAHVVYTMTVFRDHCWVRSLLVTATCMAAIWQSGIVQQIVEEDVELIGIQQTLSPVTYKV